ncbi:MAG: carboxypeptidase-like regulatory domain-containing protein [Pyrinomonadaceae bacterium]|nr:carboxypeptidase-like regulatory domain-containing protein [Pyrinomonadaceae bacterium]
MKILKLLAIVFALNIFINAQNAELEGVVTDSNGGVISNTKVILTDENNNSITKTTNEDGGYYFRTSKGKYTLEIIPPNGFEIRKFINFTINSNKMNFKIALEVDLTNSMVTDMVCPKNLDCYLVSTQKVGDRKPKIIDFQKINKLKRKTKLK